MYYKIESQWHLQIRIGIILDLLILVPLEVEFLTNIHIHSSEQLIHFDATGMTSTNCSMG